MVQEREGARAWAQCRSRWRCPMRTTYQRCRSWGRTQHLDSGARAMASPPAAVLVSAPPSPPPPQVHTAYSGLATDYCHGVEDAGAHFAGIWRAWRSMRHFACWRHFACLFACWRHFACCCHFACLFASSTSLCMSLGMLVCAQVPEPTRTSRQQRVGGNG